MPEPAASVMRMSAYQADQQHELADQDMAEKTQLSAQSMTAT